MAEPYKIPSRFYSLDVVRGGLTFFIIFFHWRHFFYDGGEVSPDFLITSQPLFSIFTPLYSQGVYAVDFFFSLSGFVFFWLYAEPIASKAVSASKYAALRFSRLYPLHIASLLLVIVAQQITVAQTGAISVYQENDWYHLLLNIFFVNAWSFEEGFSFNGPAWTVSIEVLMYIAFFLLAFIGKAQSFVVAFSISLFGILVEEYVNLQIGMGLHSFFIGGATFIIYSKLMKYKVTHILAFLTPICALLWLIAIVDMYSTVAPTLKAFTPEFIFHQAIDTLDSSLFATMLVVPTTILFLALSETVRGTLGRRIHVVGDLSYALYLLHFPLQLAFLIVTNWIGVDRSFYYSITALVSYFLVLWSLAYLSYFYFELPCQKYLRKTLIKR